MPRKSKVIMEPTLDGPVEYVIVATTDLSPIVGPSGNVFHFSNLAVARLQLKHIHNIVGLSWKLAVARPDGTLGELNE